MMATELMGKASQAIASAQLLLAHGDMDGACNRAYYAMFDAARAVLLLSDAPVQAENIRTHNGLITAFSLHLVKTGQVAVELGRALNKIEEIRLMADYKGDSVIHEDAEWVVAQARIFVDTLQTQFGTDI